MYTIVKVVEFSVLIVCSPCSHRMHKFLSKCRHCLRSIVASTSAEHRNVHSLRRRSALRSVYIPFFSFFVFKFANEKRITNSFFVFRFQICERKTKSFVVFRFQKWSKKNEKRKTNSFFVFRFQKWSKTNEKLICFSFFVFAFRMLRSHCHFGWPEKLVVSAGYFGRTGSVF